MAVEQEPRHKKARTRSPAYPYLALPEALEKAGQLWRAESRHAVSVSVAMQHWGYKAESSTGYSCIAALKKFALVDEEGVGEHREVKLSNLALAILLDEEGSPERQDALRTAALSPKIHAELWERYGTDLPSDQSLKRFLVIEKSFNEASVEEFVAEYRATVNFANLTQAGGNSGAPPVHRTDSPARDATLDPGFGWTRDNPSEREGSRSAPAGSNGGARPWQGRTAQGTATPPVALAAPKQPPGTMGGGPASHWRHESRASGGSEGNDYGQPQMHRPEMAGPDGGIAKANVQDGTKELLVPLDDDLVAKVPYPMSEEAFSLFVDTLQLWKKRLVRQGK